MNIAAAFGSVSVLVRTVVKFLTPKNTAKKIKSSLFDCMFLTPVSMVVNGSIRFVVNTTLRRQ